MPETHRQHLLPSGFVDFRTKQPPDRRMFQPSSALRRNAEANAEFKNLETEKLVVEHVQAGRRAQEGRAPFQASGQRESAESFHGQSRLSF